MLDIKKMKIIRVTKYDFELENGQVFEHIEPLDEIPTLEEFQKIYNECFDNIQKIMDSDNE